jgi:predicted ATPase
MASTHDENGRARAEEPWRLRSLHVQNYKSLDDVGVEFPRPTTPDELDAFVLGSRNGVGKTSLLECCALAGVAASLPNLLVQDRRMRDEADLHDLLVRSGASEARVEAELDGSGPTRGADSSVMLRVTQTGFLAESSRQASSKPEGGRWAEHEDEGILDSLLGMSSEPLILPSVLLFHSYRKVQEGSSALGAMLDPTFARRRTAPWRYGAPGPLSTFKIALVRALMARSGLFEGVRAQRDDEQVVEKLNGLLEGFAGGIVDKLRPRPDGTLEIRVTPSKGGASFSFDGLSSGQKEIIATLFLIWFMTQERPALVLIDEPELHLNAEWQRIFVHQLAALAPKNQYILATHADEIFSSVSEGRRLMLSRG